MQQLHPLAPMQGPRVFDGVPELLCGCSGVPVNDQVTCCSTSVAYSSFAAMFWQAREGRQGRPFSLDTLWPTETEGTLAPARFYLHLCHDHAPGVAEHWHAAQTYRALMCWRHVLLQMAKHARFQTVKPARCRGASHLYTSGSARKPYKAERRRDAIYK